MVANGDNNNPPDPNRPHRNTSPPRLTAEAKGKGRERRIVEETQDLARCLSDNSPVNPAGTDMPAFHLAHTNEATTDSERNTTEQVSVEYLAQRLSEHLRLKPIPQRASHRSQASSFSNDSKPEDQQMPLPIGTELKLGLIPKRQIYTDNPAASLATHPPLPPSRQAYNGMMPIPYSTRDVHEWLASRGALEHHAEFVRSARDAGISIITTRLDRERFARTPSGSNNNHSCRPSTPPRHTLNPSSDVRNTPSSTHSSPTANSSVGSQHSHSTSGVEKYEFSELVCTPGFGGYGVSYGITSYRSPDGTSSTQAPYATRSNQSPHATRSIQSPHGRNSDQSRGSANPRQSAYGPSSQHQEPPFMPPTFTSIAHRPAGNHWNPNSHTEAARRENAPPFSLQHPNQDPLADASNPFARNPMDNHDHLLSLEELHARTTYQATAHPTTAHRRAASGEERTSTSAAVPRRQNWNITGVLPPNWGPGLDVFPPKPIGLVPGDWICRRFWCNYGNFKRNLICRDCGHLRVQEFSEEVTPVQTQVQPQVQPQVQSAKTGSPLGSPGDWICECTEINWARRSFCWKCYPDHPTNQDVRGRALHRQTPPRHNPLRLPPPEDAAFRDPFMTHTHPNNVTHENEAGPSRHAPFRDALMSGFHPNGTSYEHEAGPSRRAPVGNAFMNGSHPDTTTDENGAGPSRRQQNSGNHQHNAERRQNRGNGNYGPSK